MVGRTNENMIVKNPTNETVSITIAGRDYTLEAEGSISVIDEHAAKWKVTHQFLVLSEEEKVAPTPEVVEETVAPEETTPEVVEEVVEEKKAKATRFGGKVTVKK
jgi:hypothetical protein